jgi:hypothetical protein
MFIDSSIRNKKFYTEEDFESMFPNSHEYWKEYRHRFKQSIIDMIKELIMDRKKLLKQDDFNNTVVPYLPENHQQLWYNYYIDEYNENRNKGRPLATDISYPFKSKINKYKKKHPDVIYRDNIISDRLGKVQKKQLKLKQKPTFSKYFYSWQIDYVFNLTDNVSIHLVLINVNTRFLIIRRVRDRSSNTLDNILEYIFNNYLNDMNGKYETDRFQIANLCGDSEKSFVQLSKRFSDNHISTYWQSSQFTNHNRIVDSVIRTIRLAISNRNINDDQLQQIVEYYNNTYHSSIDCTPLEMMLHPEYEEQYIRFCTQKLINIDKYYNDYDVGNILLVHLDFGKTSNSYEKTLQFWNRVVEFIKYQNGNCLVKLLSKQKSIRNNNVFEIPLYLTKFIATDINSIPDYIKNSYSI